MEACSRSMKGCKRKYASINYLMGNISEKVEYESACVSDSEILYGVSNKETTQSAKTKSKIRTPAQRFNLKDSENTCLNLSSEVQVEKVNPGFKSKKEQRDSSSNGSKSIKNKKTNKKTPDPSFQLSKKKKLSLNYSQINKESSTTSIDEPTNRKRKDSKNKRPPLKSSSSIARKIASHKVKVSQVKSKSPLSSKIHPPQSVSTSSDYDSKREFLKEDVKAARLLLFLSRSQNQNQSSRGTRPFVFTAKPKPMGVKKPVDKGSREVDKLSKDNKNLIENEEGKTKMDYDGDATTASAYSKGGDSDDSDDSDDDGNNNTDGDYDGTGDDDGRKKS